MSGMRLLTAALLVAGLLYLLHPSRQLGPVGGSGARVVEIVYMGPGGPIAGAMDDAVKAFEKWSRERHAREPDQPVYRVVSGQSAARDQVADPTRFLVSVAGGSSPDVIWFDRFAVTEWSARGAFLPLDDFLARDAAARAEGRLDVDPPRAEDYYAPCWDETQFRDPRTGAAHVYAVPISVDNRALYVNRDRLERAGFVDAGNRPRPPETWADLARYAFDLSEWDPEPPAGPTSWDRARSRVMRYNLMLALLQARWDASAIAPPARWGCGGSNEYDRALSEIWHGPRPESFTGEERAYAAELARWAASRRLRALGFAPNYGNAWLYMYGWMNGAGFMSADGRECRLNEPAVGEALAFMKAVYDLAGAAPPVAGQPIHGYQEVNGFQAGFGGGELDPFIQGKVAMKIDGVWSVANLARFGRDMNFGIAPPPRPARVIDALRSAGRDSRMSWCGGWALAIPAAARHQEAAWEFIRFLSSPHAQRIWAESERALMRSQGVLYLPGQRPHRKINEEFFARYVEQNPEVPDKFREALRVFNALLPVSRFRPVTPVGQRLWNEHVSRTEQALYGADIQSSLNQGTQAVQRDLDRFFRPPPSARIRTWTWFFATYAGLLAALGTAAYFWDTKAGFRRRLARRLGMARGREEAVIEGSRGGYFRRQWLGGFVCALPWLIGFVAFEGGPMLFSFVISCCEYDILQPPGFVGTRNYVWMFTRDANVPVSLANTAYMILGVPVGLVVSLAIALLLNLRIRGVAVWRTFFYLPAIVPMVAASVLWIQMLNPQIGFLNQALRPMLAAFGLRPPGWFQDPFWSKPSLILMGLWSAGGGMIVWLAGLKSIDPSLYEAASVDGANEWRKLLHVTLPQLTPYLFFNLVMGLIGTFQVFGQAFIMTQGGPRDSTLFYVYHLFNNAFRYGHMGYASAMAWVLFVVVLGLTAVQLKLSRRWVYYEHE